MDQGRLSTMEEGKKVETEGHNRVDTQRWPHHAELLRVEQYHRIDTLYDQGFSGRKNEASKAKHIKVEMERYLAIKIKV